jgi:hypothetical protein
MPLADDINGWINQASQMFGVSSSYLTTTAMLESGGNPLANQGNSSPYKGLYQIGPAAAKDWGVSDPFNAQQSVFGAASGGALNLASLTKSLGRAPQDWELYLGHQQGASGAASILNNPGQYASDGVSNFLGNINAAEFKKLTGVDVNNPMQVATNADFASYWKQKYQATSGATDPAVSIPALGGSSSQYTAASEAAKLAADVAGGKGATADASGGDTSTWMLWIEHQAVRGAVIVAGFIFLGTGLGLFALGAVFSNPVAGSIATSWAGARIARSGGSSTPPIEPPEPPKGGAGGATPLTPRGGGGGAPGFIRLGAPRSKQIEGSLATDFPGLPEVKEAVVFPTDEQARRGESRFRGVGSMVEVDPATGEVLRQLRGIGDDPNGPITYVPADKSKDELIKEAGIDPKELLQPGTPESEQRDVANVMLPTGDAGAKLTQVPGAKQKKKAQGKVKEALAKMQPLSKSEAAQISAPENDDMLNRNVAPERSFQVPSFGEFSVGKFAILKDPKGKGRTSEPLKIVEIWKDAKGVGVVVKGEKSGKGMFPIEELSVDVKPVRKAKQKGLLEKLGVLRDFTKPGPKKR